MKEPKDPPRFELRLKPDESTLFNAVAKRLNKRKGALLKDLLQAEADRLGIKIEPAPTNSTALGWAEHLALAVDKMGAAGLDESAMLAAAKGYIENENNELGI